MGHEPGIDIARHPADVVDERHGSAAHDEHVGHDAPAGKALAEGGEGLFQFGPAEQNIVGAAHAASKTAADT